MNPKLISSLLAVLAFILSPALLAESGEDKEMKDAAGIFDFSDLDVPPDPALPAKTTAPPAPNDPLPASVREVLQKWDRFQASKESARRTQVKAMRQVASEILFKRAAAADAAARPALMEEAKRLAALDAGESIAAPAAPAVGQSLVGSWAVKDGMSAWHYTEEGRMLTGKDEVPWSWMDEKNGVALAIWGRQYPNLIWQKGDRYESIDLYFPPAQRTRVKSPARSATATAAAAPVLTKLAADEKDLILSRDKLFAEKRTRIAAFLRAQVKDAKGPAVAAIMEKSAAMDAAAPASTAPVPAAVGRVKIHGADRIAGKWEWPGGKKATLAPDGTATVEGLGAGFWRAGNDAAWAVAIVLRDKFGRVTAPNQLLLGKFSESKPSVVHLRDLSGKKFDVQKTGAP